MAFCILLVLNPKHNHCLPFHSLQTIGSQVLVKIVKNKHAPPFRTVEFELQFGKGICRESELIELGVKHKFIKKSGGFYYINDATLHGKENCKQYLATNPSTREELMTKLRRKLLDAESDTEKKVGQEDVDQNTPKEEVVVSDSTDEEVVAAVEA